MVVCKRCGVELDSEIQICPLCEMPVIEGLKVEEYVANEASSEQKSRPQLLKHILWQIVCVLLVSGIFATLIINLSVVGYVTWSIYPITVCLIILSYASFIALWNAKPFIQIIAGWIASSGVLVAVQLYTNEDWPLLLALPLVSAVHVIGMLLEFVIKKLKGKGLNRVAILFIGVAVLCLIIDGILSLYFQHELQLSWGVVVSACLLPVIAAILFMYFRTKNNRHLQKIFHT